MQPFFTRAFLSSVFLLSLFTDSYSQCGVAPTSGTTTIASANQIVNSYYPGTGNPIIGATTLTVGTLDARGSATALANGDMVLIIQMQGADYNSTNSDSYGDGISGGNASGYLTSNLVAGRYEYNIVSNFNSGTGDITFSYTLANNYYTQAYSASTGIRTYQVIRVPRYYDLTINAGGSITAPTWNGSTGGVIVLEAANVITINGSVTANALGFRGGGGKRFIGVTAGNTNGTGAITNTDFRWASPVTVAANTTGGAKGEGIAGTPIYTLTNGATNATTNAVEGYIDGTMGRGAPGNAGGGGTDGDPGQNRFNPGGGGGGNGGAGGKGGSGWDNGAANPNTYPTGGYGGAAFAQGSLQRFVLGGGGGAGTSNNSTAGTTDYLSSGACGGGIIIIRGRSFSGNGSVTANGAGSNNVSAAGVTDAAGGGGAGGTILVATNQTGSVGTHTITASANGGKGGDMSSHWAHGPGGGGGGGLVISNVIPSGSITVTGGANGLTRSASGVAVPDIPYGAVAGSNGVIGVLIGPVGLVNSSNGTSQCGVLPITLHTWNGVYKNNKTYLTWQTDQGSNFSHFVIEHSTDGIHFSSLGQVAASTSTASTLQYSFVDAFPASGVNYYRLKMVDIDGQYKYSGIITLRPDAKGVRVSATPNPFTDHVVITIESATDEAVQLRVFNSDGKLVWRKASFVTAGTNAQYYNDLQSLPKGIYFIKVNKQNTVAEIKIIKQ
ncbi:T9SS type A sorting domain-containing protein [Niastella caeni]|uniref:T9SS type A sorting domain-containing protein n=1 Tax=Niastella caeni TaxID=2569763 RepID=A0A4S8HSW7_9BACT|nr:T9SS type A sorting domain-containing protein [Niastella caeni]THU38385.1 T9SS type A sorting domain-containing protein [Niastella caeni]